MFYIFIIFNDEATFCLNDYVSRHSSWYLSDCNPHFMEKIHSHYPGKNIVLVGLVKKQIIYWKCANIIYQINHLFTNMNVYCQQAGAPPHYQRDVRQYLNTIIPDRWNGRRGMIE